MSKFKYNVLVADIETNAIENTKTYGWPTLSGLEKMYCMTLINPITDEVFEFNEEKNNIEEGLQMLRDTEYVVGHNFIGFDAVALFKLYEVRLNKIIDTMLMSKVMFPDIEDQDNIKGIEFPEEWKGKWSRHKLAAWGVRLGEHKSEFSDFSKFTQEMQDYCTQDVKTNVVLYKHLLEQSKSSKALILEHEFAKTITIQQLNGFPFDVEKANALVKDLLIKRADLEQELQKVFPPIVEKTKTSKGWRLSVEGKDFEAPTKVKLKALLKSEGLKQSYANEAEKMECYTKSVPFNPNSRQQIADRFLEMGWEPTKRTAKTNQPVIDESVLKEINSPESLKLCDYLIVGKRIGQIAEGQYAWLSMVSPEGKIHGSVDTCACISTRCTHNRPNMAQIPAVGSFYGEECRSLFKAPEGKVLVGVDCSGVELRAFSSYLHQFDKGEYAKEVVEGDIHSKHAEILGISRPEAKTFIYAFLYGAGFQKLGEIVGKGIREGRRLKQTFSRRIPAYAKLIKAIEDSIDVKGTIQTIDGREIKPRSKHSALNLLIQSSGSILMKQSCVCFRDNAKHPYEMHANVHDEVQFSCLPEHAEELGKTFCDSITQAGKLLGFKALFEGEYKVGNNWAETH